MVAGGTVNAILYGHTEDFFQSYYTLQSPTPWFNPDVRRNVLLPSLQAHTPAGTIVNIDQMIVWGQLTSDALHMRDGRMATHGGLYFEQPWDIGRGPIRLYTYITVEAETQAGAADEVAVAPEIGVRAAWESRSTEDEPVEVLAAGQSESFLAIPVMNGSTTYEVAIDLHSVIQNEPSGHDTQWSKMRIVVEPFQVESDVIDAVQTEISWRSSQEFPWRLILPIQDPLRTSQLFVTAPDESGATKVSWHVSSAFGFYDVDAESFRLVGQDSTGTIVSEMAPEHVTTLRYTHSEGILPAKALWTISPSDMARDLQWTLYAVNHQGTYSLVQPLDVQISETTPESLTAVSAGAALTGLALGVAVSRSLRRVR